jgi:hypothetical protein
MLLPLFPLALGAALLSRSRAYRGAVVVMFLLLQIVWVVWLWAWAQLPGGGIIRREEVLDFQIRQKGAGIRT